MDISISNPPTILDRYQQECEPLVTRILKSDWDRIPVEYHSFYQVIQETICSWWQIWPCFGPDTSALKLLIRMNRILNLCSQKAPKCILEKELGLIQKAKDEVSFMLDLHEIAVEHRKCADARHIYLIDFQNDDIVVRHLKDNWIGEIPETDLPCS